MDIQFENCYESSRQLYKEMLLYRHYRSPGMVARYVVMGLFLIIGILLLIAGGAQKLATWVFLLGPIAAVISWVVRYKRALRQALQQEAEAAKHKGMLVTVTSTDIVVGEFGNEEKSVTFPLANFVKLKQTKSYIILYTKAGNIAVLKKDAFTVGTADDFIAFIYDHQHSAE